MVVLPMATQIPQVPQVPVEQSTAKSQLTFMVDTEGKGRFEGPSIPEDMLHEPTTAPLVRSRQLKAIASFFIFGLLVAGMIASFILAQTNQDIRQKAIETLEYILEPRK